MRKPERKTQHATERRSQETERAQSVLIRLREARPRRAMNGVPASPRILGNPMNFRALFHSVLLPALAGAGFLVAQNAPPTTMPWKDPSYDKDRPESHAIPRPDPGEGPNSWPLWMKHHENRKRWVAEQDVDLLMVGDSIVFGWSRIGKPVWDEYFGKSSAVNIGSSGDRICHMLWHFQNGGLDGMKKHNPKVVVVMMGTNNRGEPEKKGADTAYGVLALLKEIHAKLPESKILLLAIFPRGDKPEDAGRLRNQEINAILQTYADGKTVHWLDIGPSFLNADGTLKRDLMPDALHPNLEGYRVWAEAMKPALEKLMGGK